MNGSIVEKERYYLNRSQFFEQRLSHCKSSGNLLENIEVHMSNLFELEEQSHNSLKAYIENRGVLEALLRGRKTRAAA